MKESEVKIYDDATWGNTGKDIIPSKFYQAYHVFGPWNGDDESLWYSFDAFDEDGTTRLKSEIALVPKLDNIVANKWGMSIGDIEISVTITPNEKLKAKFPESMVRIDGVYYDMGILENPIKLMMYGDHRISILWAPDLVETFRICRKL